MNSNTQSSEIHICEGILDEKGEGKMCLVQVISEVCRSISPASTKYLSFCCRIIVCKSTMKWLSTLLGTNEGKMDEEDDGGPPTLWSLW